MAVSEQTPYKEYTANGTTTDFALEFDCSNSDYLVVTVNDLNTNIADWVLDGGNVKFKYPPIQDSIIKIWRDSPLQRSTIFKSYDNSFSAEALNIDIDKLWLALQDFRVKHKLSDDKVQELISSITSGNVNGLPAEILSRIAGDNNLAQLIANEQDRAYRAEISLQNEKASKQELIEAVTPKADKIYVDQLVINSNNNITNYQTQAALLAFTPTTANYTAKALDTKKVWLWDGAKWNDTGLSELDLAKEFSQKYGYIFSGYLTKCDYDASSGNYTISHTELRFDFGGGKSFVLVAPKTDLIVPASRLYYVDLNGAVVGSTLTGQVTPTDYNSAAHGIGTFVEDLKIPLFSHRGGKGGLQIGGRLLQNGLPIKPHLDLQKKYIDDQDLIINLRAIKNGYIFSGYLTKCDYDASSGNYTISHTELRFDFGGGKSFVLVAPQTDLIIPASRLYYVDLTGATVGSTLTGQVTPTDYNSAAHGIGTFVEDLKIPLFAHRGGKNGQQIGGKLLQNGRPQVAPIPPTATLDAVIVRKTTATTMSFYIKGTGNNYLKYGFNRTQVPFDAGASYNSQSDHWRIIGCYEVDGNFNDVRGGRPVVAIGEWECAIRESGGKADAVGGYHGDELQTNSFFVVDGKRYAQDAVFDLNVKELQFVQESVIYSCNTQTPICKHLKRYRITKEGIDLYQEFDWLAATSIANAWLTMLPIKRLLNDTSGAQITDRATRYPSYDLEDITVDGFDRLYTTVKDGDSVLIWGDTSGISAEVIFKKTATSLASMYIDSPTAYNKMYFLGTGQSTYITTVGEKWIQHSLFKLNTSN